MSSQRYSEREQKVFLWILLPYTVGMNAIFLGSCIFDSLYTFLTSFLVSAIYLFAYYFLCSRVAAIIQKRFPANNELFKRIAVMLPVFYLMTVVMVSGLYTIYDHPPLSSCQPLPGNFVWAIAFGCFSGTIITFLNEAVLNWKKWKESVTETEQLKNAYQKTKLLGLKGQINPHFLFNCFNSLSSLIADDQERAEEFLDEMTKVHRYMLRGDDEQLVSLKEELKFARSYLYLTQVRFGDAIQALIETDIAFEDYRLPALTLQVILENIIYNNSASRSAPLRLSIVVENERLTISHIVRPRTSNEEGNPNEGIDHLEQKFRLLHASGFDIQSNEQKRVITLPLLTNKPLTA